MIDTYLCENSFTYRININTITNHFLLMVMEKKSVTVKKSTYK